MFTPHTSCRACGLGKAEIPTLKVSTAAGDAYAKAQSLVPVLSLGLQPPSNNFTEPAGEKEGYAPLDVLVCPRCGLAQLSATVRPEILYKNYAYITSHSKTMMDHFELIRDDIVSEATLVGSVLEIGSNDGTLLQFLKNHPFEHVLGCDPAENLAAIANKNGIPTFCGFFTSKDCDCDLKKDVVIARHVMCHIDDWQDFVLGLERVTHKESLVCIEVPYYKDMIDKGSWDQVYHEHLSYMNVRAMEALLRNSKFHIHKIKHYAIHGGCVMLFLRRNEYGLPPDGSVATHLDSESNIVSEWKALGQRSEDMIFALKAFVREAQEQNKYVVGYGASAKSTVWLNACGFRKKDIRFICDETPTKAYKVCPGTDIPVADPGALTRELPDYAICFAHNFFTEIYDKEKIFREKGGKWVVPLPELKVV